MPILPFLLAPTRAVAARPARERPCPATSALGRSRTRSRGHRNEEPAPPARAFMLTIVQGITLANPGREAEIRTTMTRTTLGLVEQFDFYGAITPMVAQAFDRSLHRRGAAPARRILRHPARPQAGRTAGTARRGDAAGGGDVGHASRPSSPLGRRACAHGGGRAVAVVTTAAFAAAGSRPLTRPAAAARAARTDPFASAIETAHRKTVSARPAPGVGRRVLKSANRKIHNPSNTARHRRGARLTPPPRPGCAARSRMPYSAPRRGRGAAGRRWDTESAPCAGGTGPGRGAGTASRRRS
jgi:hypothetical protein